MLVGSNLMRGTFYFLSMQNNINAIYRCTNCNQLMCQLKCQHQLLMLIKCKCSDVSGSQDSSHSRKIWHRLLLFVGIRLLAFGYCIETPSIQKSIQTTSTPLTTLTTLKTPTTLSILTYQGTIPGDKTCNLPPKQPGTETYYTETPTLF